MVQEPEDFSRVVLEIPGHDHSRVTGRVAQAGGRCGVAAIVARETNDLHARIVCTSLEEADECLVGAAVLDEEKLPIEPLRAPRGLTEGIEHGHDVVALVADGHYHGEESWHGREYAESADERLPIQGAGGWWVRIPARVLEGSGLAGRPRPRCPVSDRRRGMGTPHRPGGSRGTV